MFNLSLEEDAINLHRMLKGKIEIHNRVSVDSLSKDKNHTLELIYTPGVAYVAKEISKNKELTYDYTSKCNTVAIVCDGTRVLDLGNIGPEGAIPVMEGKSVLFKVLGGKSRPACNSYSNNFSCILRVYSHWLHLVGVQSFYVHTGIWKISSLYLRRSLHFYHRR